MKVHMVFYGGLKQDVGTKQQTLDLDQNTITIQELGEILKVRYPALRSRLETVAYVVHNEIVDPDFLLHDGDEAALLPPVSGG